MPDPVSAIAAGSAISGIANIFGSQSAAAAQREAADKAAAATLQQQRQGLDAQRGYVDRGANALQPLADRGNQVYGSLVDRLPDLTAPINMDENTLQHTPGYRWNLEQGIRGVDLSSAARGLSGAQLKAAATFATGLADTTYRNQFDMANINKSNAFNRLLGTAQVGTDASKYLANNLTSAGNADLTNSQGVGGQLGQYATNAGQATAAADIATGANAGAIASAPGNALLTNRLLSNGNSPQATSTFGYNPLAGAFNFGSSGMYGK